MTYNNYSLQVELYIIISKSPMHIAHLLKILLMVLKGIKDEHINVSLKVPVIQILNL
jgi:hypothetical protein